MERFQNACVIKAQNCSSNEEGPLVSTPYSPCPLLLLCALGRDEPGVPFPVSGDMHPYLCEGIVALKLSLEFFLLPSTYG